MSRYPFPSLWLGGSIAVTATGVAIADGVTPSVRTVSAILAMALGLAGVASLAADLSVDDLERASKRRWVVAVIAFFPYAMATAPASESAAAVADSLVGWPSVVLEAVAGALVLVAVTTTVLYGFARYGIHPGAPTPEERILDDTLDD